MNHGKNPRTESEFSVERREALKNFAVIFAGVLSAKSIHAAVSDDRREQIPNRWVLNSHELDLVKQMAELIIPATDTPGASGADVHSFIDFQVGKCFTKDEQKQFLKNLKKIDAAAIQLYKKKFLECSEKSQVEMFHHIESKRAGFTESDKTFFRQFKALTLLGYYTSEVGATQELNYLPVPGGYKGSVPFAEIGKAWSLNEYL